MVGRRKKLWSLTLTPAHPPTRVSSHRKPDSEVEGGFKVFENRFTVGKYVILDGLSLKSLSIEICPIFGGHDVEPFQKFWKPGLEIMPNLCRVLKHPKITKKNPKNPKNMYMKSIYPTYPNHPQTYPGDFLG